MEKPKASILPLPASAQFHFALAQDEYVGVLSACQYFAKNLRSDSEKATMQRALAKLDRPTGISVPSEAEADVNTAVPRKAEASIGELVGSPNPQSVARTGGATPPTAAKGLAGLGGKSSAR